MASFTIETESILHILNAISPAFTASFDIYDDDVFITDYICSSLAQAPIEL